MTPKLNNYSTLDYEGEHKGKLLYDVPCSYLVSLYDYTYNLPKDLDNWLEDKIKYLEKIAGFGKDKTIRDYPNIEEEDFF